jgi:hypothetical protein
MFFYFLNFNLLVHVVWLVCYSKPRGTLAKAGGTLVCLGAVVDNHSPISVLPVLSFTYATGFPLVWFTRIPWRWRYWVPKYWYPSTKILDGTAINPLMPELNPSALCCLTRFFTGDFASWTVNFVNICVKNQQLQQLFIQFINYVW